MRDVIMWNLMTLDGCFEGKQPWDLSFHEDAWNEELEKLAIEQLAGADALNTRLVRGDPPREVGRPLFPTADPRARTKLRLLDSWTTAKGCIVASYAPLTSTR